MSGPSGSEVWRVHIPDGYLSPIVSVGMGAATLPGWAIATRRVQAVLSNRTIPLLAIFAALSFTIMMFNVPVPGGTTAHGVGGTLAAIVLGPWAAAIAVSVALIIQALFFGDGGVLAIFANCLNMAFVLPLVGYATYRLLAGRSPILSSRRVWAAGIGAYVGITASALAVGVELGVQPLLFSENGHALYSPYGLTEAIPAMLLAHAVGASIVEGLITAFGLAYLQSRYPAYLGLLGRAGPGAVTDAGAELRAEPGAVAGGADALDTDGAAPDAEARSRRRTVAGLAIGGLAVITAAAVVTGGGDPGHAFGADWAAVDWPSVAVMLVVVAIIAAIAVPVAWLVLPRRLKRLGAAFTAAAVLAPLGLIAPGFAYGEGSSGDVGAAFGYVPKGLHDLSTIFSAPLAGYELPFGPKGALWQQAIGYEFAGMLGIVLLGAATYGLGLGLVRLAGRRGPHDAVSHSAGGRAGRSRGRGTWVESTLAGITSSVERSVFTEEHARTAGWLQAVDPRAKLGMFIVVVLAASLSSSLAVLVALYAVVLAAARASRLPFGFFVRRVWLGIPLFAGLVVLPAIFFVPGPRLFDVALGPLHVAPSIPGLEGAVLFVARVGVSVSLAVLLVMTTPWADLLKSLQALRVPRLFILVLAMAYRYIFLFLHLANGLFEARKSRIVAATSGGEQRRWIAASMGSLMNRSVRMSNDVYAAMMARGFGGSIRTFNDDRMRSADWAALGGSIAIAVIAVAIGGILQ